VQHPFVSTRAEGLRDLGTLNGFSRAEAVNEDGWVVGYFVRPEGGFGTFLWTPRTPMRDVTPATLWSTRRRAHCGCRRPA
jgi:hypothetical protein